MKSTNTIVLLLIAIAVIAAIYYQKKKDESVVGTAAIPEKTIDAVTTGSLERIVIKSPDQPAVELTRVGGTWYADAKQKYEADENLVKSAIKAVSEPIQASVVSTNPDSFEDYLVTDTTATKVQIFSIGRDRPELSLLIGKDGPSAFTTYVRLPDTQEVLNAKANLSMAFKRPDGWRKRAIFEFSGANATRIESSGSSATYTLAKQDAGWKLAQPEEAEAESAKASTIANMMGNLRAVDFADMTSATLADLGLEPPRQTVTVEYEDKATSPSKLTTATLLIGSQVKKDAGEDEESLSGDWYAKRQDKSDVFTIGDATARNLLPTLDEVKVEPPVAEETEDQATTATLDQTTTATLDQATTATIDQAPPQTGETDATTETTGTATGTAEAAARVESSNDEATTQTTEAASRSTGATTAETQTTGTP